MNYHLFFTLLAALLDPEKRSLMDFYESQIRFLMAHLHKRPTPTLGEKTAMARSAAEVGYKRLQEILTIFTPDTLFRWHRELVRRKWGYSKKRGPGKPSTAKEIESLIIQFTQENKGWGYHNLQKALHSLGFKVSQSTIRNIPKLTFKIIISVLTHKPQVYGSSFWSPLFQRE